MGPSGKNIPPIPMIQWSWSVMKMAILVGQSFPCERSPWKLWFEYWISSCRGPVLGLSQAKRRQEALQAKKEATWDSLEKGEFRTCFICITRRPILSYCLDSFRSFPKAFPLAIQAIHVHDCSCRLTWVEQSTHVDFLGEQSDTGIKNRRWSVGASKKRCFGRMKPVLHRHCLWFLSV